MPTLSEVFDVICFVVGPVLFVTGFFDAFRHNTSTAEGLMALNKNILFYPKSGDLVLIGWGVGLICLGVVIRSWKKREKPNHD